MIAHSIRRAHRGELSALVAIDDAATSLLTAAGLHIDISPQHPFSQAEVRRWARSIEQGLAHVAVDTSDRPVGFAALGLVDGEPYLDQLSVHPAFMRRGIGSALLRHAVRLSAPRPLRLTTYEHLPWNAPFYERHGFVRLDLSACGPELLRHLEAERAALPAPAQRIAMVLSCRGARC